MLEPQDSEYLWLVVVGFILAFVLAFGIGANDVANSFGTSVGSKVLTLKQACIIASIFEVAGAVLIGARVSDTVRKGIIDINSFNGTEELAMVGSLSALTGTSVWLLIATFFNLPVSGTHSVVGATMGFALVAHGLAGVKWPTFGKIAGSWVISPLMSGISSSLIFVFINKLILTKEPPFEQGLKYLPLFYAFTLTVNLFSVFYKGSQVLGFHKIPLYGVFILTFGGGLLTALLVRVFLVPYTRKRIQPDQEGQDKVIIGARDPCGPPVEPKDTTSSFVLSNIFADQEKQDVLHEKTEKETEEKEIKITDTKDEVIINECVNNNDDVISNEDVAKKDDVKETNPTDELEIQGESAMELARRKIQDEPKTAKLFSFLQIMTACFGAFAHGGNDVSNCIGPLISLWTIFYTGYIQQKVAISVWILLYGGAGISIGLWVWGRRVIKTVGEDLTPITPSSGFCIEIGSAITVLIASNLGIPISTTHCKVGSVVMVGRVRSKMVVDWSIFKNVVFAWIVTMPVAGGLSAAVYAALREVI